MNHLLDLNVLETSPGFWQDKTVWLSGATGAWGREFCKQLLTFPIKKLLMYCRGEHRAVQLQRKLNDERTRIHLGDIRDRERLIESFAGGVDVVIHAAALKRIEAADYNPYELVSVNIFGTYQLTRTILYDAPQKVEKAFFVSSDKACRAETLYGSTKYVGEQIWHRSNIYSPAPNPPHFLVGRFGNALWSTGSVLEIWEEQKAKGEPLTITKPGMTRFLVTIPEAVKFALWVIENGTTDGLYVPRLPGARIIELAHAFDPGCKMNILNEERAGGEKIHEELLPGYQSDVASMVWGLGDYIWRARKNLA